MNLGAQLWHHSAPWHPDPGESLFELQIQFLKQTYNLSSLIKEHLESAREAVRICAKEGDPYELLDFHREELARLDDMSRRPIPHDPREQIELVRKICMSSGEGVGNVLDVTGVDDEGSELKARKLKPEEIREFCETDRPTLRQARNAVSRINEELRRGQSVCFPIHDHGAEGEPIGWYFVGNTID
jgi:hypothetical protein